MMDAKELAVLFHDTYERLAPSFGYETREETRQFDETTPNGRLMVAVCGEITEALQLSKPGYRRMWLKEEPVIRPEFSVDYEEIDP